MIQEYRVKYQCPTCHGAWLLTVKGGGRLPQVKCLNDLCIGLLMPVTGSRIWEKNPSGDWSLTNTKVEYKRPKKVIH